MSTIQKLEVPVQGMDCTECTMHVRHALETLPGVHSVEVFLSSEKAILQLDPQQVGMEQIRQAVSQAGYRVPESAPGSPNLADQESARAASLKGFTRPIVTLLGVVFAAVLFVVVVGEWLGLFEAITERIPWPVGVAVVLLFGYPVLRNVIQAALRRQVISHTLMAVGVVAALAVGEWATAAVVVFFMRVGDYVEHFTAERARRAVKDLTALAPQTARLEHDGSEVEVPVGQVHPGDIVVIRPGEQVPVDGQVLTGHAAIDQAAITGEAMPVEAGPGAPVYAATLLRTGSLRVRATQVGADTTFGRVIRLVEEAEAHRADVQRVADRFSAYYLPIVGGIAFLTFLISRDPLATCAVLVVACSCSFALATPIAMLASIGAGAKRGLMIKGGKYLELLDKADMLLIDKTGTLTLGRPYLADCQVFNSFDADELLRLAASAERYSEHPLAEAVREEAARRGCRLEDPQEFESIPGKGVRARVAGRLVEVGSRRMFPALEVVSTADDAPAINSGPGPAAAATPGREVVQAAAVLEAQGKSLLFVGVEGRMVGLLAAADQLRPEVPAALRELRRLGFASIELLTGDNPRAAAALAEKLGADLSVQVRANLLPEHKIEIVRQHQAQGRRVVMVGDGVNDAPALAQADVGIAMGAVGSDIAIEAAHIALMRDDWRLVPEVVLIARRTMKVVRMNIGFTALYNLVGLSLAAFGFLPPIMAAAAQSLPDLGILANSSRLLRQK